MNSTFEEYTTVNKFKFFVTIFFWIPLAIISLILGSVYPNICDLSLNAIGYEGTLTVNQYLFAWGGAELIFSSIVIILFSCIPCKAITSSITTEIGTFRKELQSTLACFHGIYVVYSLIIMIIGGITLFGGPNCSQFISYQTNYVIFIWSLSIIQTIVNIMGMCCGALRQGLFKELDSCNDCYKIQLPCSIICCYEYIHNFKQLYYHSKSDTVVNTV